MCAVAVLALVGTVSTLVWRHSPTIPSLTYGDGAPQATDITGFVDGLWADGRIVTYGVKAAALFADPSEERFVGRLLFLPDELLAQAQDEQLHILIPPNNGLYYSGSSALAQVHREGRNWLFLERESASGWQLWRVALPPQRESRLRFLE